MPTSSGGYDCCGGVEEISCMTILDGPWQIQATLEEDCDDVNDWQTIWECWGTHDPTITIEIRDPRDYYNPVPLYPLIQNKLTEKGQTKKWLMIREGGVWQGAPQQI